MSLRSSVHCIAVFVVAVLLSSTVLPAFAQEKSVKPPGVPLRIMALGDSITAGVAANGGRAQDGGYRGVLARSLASAGYQVQFVGSRSDYSDDIANHAHEGWPGYVLRSYPSDPGPGQLIGPRTRSAIMQYDPDVILVMAGTNDLLRAAKHDTGYTLANIVHSMDLLLDEIVTVKPTVRIPQCLLAAFNGDSACGPPGEYTVRSVVARYAQLHYHVMYASQMASAVPRDLAHFPDGLHPSGEGGYADIAGVWLTAFKSLSTNLTTDPIANR
jgi:lysophospholipase L1-like esterase